MKRKDRKTARMNGIELITAERNRQIEKEGWTAEHDAEHNGGELSLVAALYATPIPLFKVTSLSRSVTWYDPWPWDLDWDKRRKHSRLRRLEIAGALIAAEIDRELLKSETV